MPVAVYKSEKEKSDPMARALQMLQIGASATSIAGGLKGSSTPTPNQAVDFEDLAKAQSTSLPADINGGGNNTTAMGRKLNGKKNYYGGIA